MKHDNFLKKVLAFDGEQHLLQSLSALENTNLPLQSLVQRITSLKEELSQLEQKYQTLTHGAQSIYTKFLPIYLSNSKSIAYFSPIGKKEKIGTLPVNKIHTLQGDYLFQTNKGVLPLNQIKISETQKTTMQDFLQWAKTNNKLK